MIEQAGGTGRGVQVDGPVARRRRASRIASLLPVWMVAAAVLATAGCRSPIASEEETGPADDPSKVGTGIHGWPVYERDVLRRGVRTDVLWPLASVRTDAAGEIERASFLAYLLHFEDTATSHRFAIRPLFERGERVLPAPAKPPAGAPDVAGTPDVADAAASPGIETDLTLLWPLFHRAESPRRSETTLVLWNERTGPDETAQVLFPLWWHGHSRNSAAQDAEPSSEWTWLLPFGGVSRSGTETTTGVLPPLFFRSEDPVAGSASTDVLWPLFHVGRDAPDARSSRFLPLWWHEIERDHELAIVFPIYYTRRDGAEETEVWFPLHGRHRAPDEDVRIYGGNLLVLTDRKDGGSATDVLWPLVHHGRRADGSSKTRVFPILWSDTEASDGYFHLWPLAGRSWDGDERQTFVAWPLFRHKSTPTSGETRILEPFCEFRASDRSRSGHVFPLFSYASEASGAADGRVALLLADWDYGDDGDGAFHVLWRLFVNERGSGRHVVALNPLFRHESNDRGDTHWSTLFGLLARTREGDDVRWRFLWFF